MVHSSYNRNIFHLCSNHRSSPDIIHLIRKLLVHEPHLRMTASEILDRLSVIIDDIIPLRILDEPLQVKVWKLDCHESFFIFYKRINYLFQVVPECAKESTQKPKRVKLADKKEKVLPDKFTKVSC